MSMIQVSTFSLLFIKGDHGVLSIYLNLVKPSFGLHLPHRESSTIDSQELIGRVHSQGTGIELPRLAIPQYVHISY